MNRIVILFTLLISLPVLSFTQERQVESNLTGILLELDKHNQVFYRHKLKAKETVYSLARFFKMPVGDLLLINRINKDDDLPIGTEILIPIQTNEILTPAKRGDTNWVPLLYTVERQETLYKISKNYFPQKIEHLINRNNIKSFSIKQGKQLVVGWWSPDTKEDAIDIVAESKVAEVNPPTKKPNTNPPSPTPETPRTTKDNTTNQEETIADIIRRKLQNKNKSKENKDNNSGEEPESDIVVLEKPADPIIESETMIDTLFPEDLTVIDTVNEEPEPVINYQSGIAIWDKEGFDRTNLFVMHKKAKVDSYIRLRYSVTGQEVTAKVIAAIPEGLYPSDTDIILSPAVAIALGAKDSRFQIQMDFYK